jgi:hypothetical protein
MNPSSKIKKRKMSATRKNVDYSPPVKRNKGTPLRIKYKDGEYDNRVLMSMNNKDEKEEN